MQIELIQPGPRSYTTAAKCDPKARLYERGGSYAVTDELGTELIKTGRFQTARAPGVSPKEAALKGRAERVVNMLAGLGDEGMERFETLLRMAAAPVAHRPPVSSSDASPVAAAPSDDSEVEGPPDDDDAGMDLLPGESRIPDSWPALLSFAADHGVQTQGKKKEQILSALAEKGIE